MLALDAADGRVHAVEEEKVLAVRHIQPLQLFVDLAQGFERKFLFRARDHDAHDLGKWREHERRAHVDLVMIEPLVVVRRRIAQDGVVGVVRLQDDVPLLSPAPAPARDLRHKLKGTFVAAIVGKMQTHVRIEDAHERHKRKVMPLGDHLRADEDVRFSLGKLL